MKNTIGAVVLGMALAATAWGGEVYEGETRDGLPHGQGKMTLPGGWVVEGEFRYGQPPTSRGEDQ